MGGKTREDGTDRDRNAVEPMAPAAVVDRDPVDRDAPVVARPDLLKPVLLNADPASADPSGTESDALGPEGDGALEIDIVRGRVAMNLETLAQDHDAAGPENDDVGLVPSEIAVSLGPPVREWLDEVGPEFDLEHVQDAPR